MRRGFQDVTEAELAVLQSLWERGRATIRQLTDELYPEGTNSQYATVKKLLERLEAKGCVRRDRGRSVHVFEASIGREELVGSRLQRVADTLCDGSLTPLLTHLVRRDKLSSHDARSLRRLIDELQQVSDSHPGQ